MVVEGAILLLLLEILLQEHNLVLDELVHELGHHVGRDLLRLLFLQDDVGVGVLLFEARVGSALDLMTTQEAAYELFDHATLEHARIVLIHSHEQVTVHLIKLFDVNQDVSEVLDGLLVVDDEVLVAAVLFI